jgi:hypothetical protein
MGYDDSDNVEEKKLAYDLRQIYANIIVGENIIDIQNHKKVKDYSGYFDSLKDLYDVVEMQFKDLEEDNKVYEQHIKDIVVIANKFQSTWIGEIKIPSECALIEDALRKLERFLYRKMKEGEMFGLKYDDDGL